MSSPSARCPRGSFGTPRCGATASRHPAMAGRPSRSRTPSRTHGCLFASARWSRAGRTRCRATCGRHWNTSRRRRREPPRMPEPALRRRTRRVVRRALITIRALLLSYKRLFCAGVPPETAGACSAARRLMFAPAARVSGEPLACDGRPARSGTPLGSGPRGRVAALQTNSLNPAPGPPESLRRARGRRPPRGPRQRLSRRVERGAGRKGYRASGGGSAGR